MRNIQQHIWTPRHFADTWRRYVEEVGELERTCDGLMNERNAMLVKLEGLKRRKQIETEVSAKHEAVSWNMQKKSKLARAKKSGGGVFRTFATDGAVEAPHTRTACAQWFLWQT